MTAVLADHAFAVKDIEYLVHGDRPLPARVFTPQGPGPFAAIVALHGGAWTNFDRLRDVAVHEALARSGLVVISPEFRQGPEGAYPKMMADINFCIRWVKAKAADLNIDPERVGLLGNSSGGASAMMAAMRPADPRYLAIPGAAADATVKCVAMLWPVINPLGRYHHAKRMDGDGNPQWAALIKSHDGYWGDEATMAEASPMMILERGEPVTLPPTLWIQGADDELHNYVDPASGVREAERFAAAYRAAGGDLDLVYFDTPGTFATRQPTLPDSLKAHALLVRFVHQHLELPCSPTPTAP